jgi:hypothetical protein
MKTYLYFIILISSISISKIKAQWAPIGPFGGTITSSAVSGSNIFVGTYAGIYLSTNNGNNWISVNNGLPAYSNIPSRPIVQSITVNGATVFATYSNSTLYSSTNNGTSWSVISVDGALNNVNSFLVNGTYLFTGTVGNGVYISSDNGVTWNSASAGLPIKATVYSLINDGNKILAGTYSGIYQSLDNGGSWALSGSGIPTNASVLSIAKNGSNLIAGTRLGGVYLSLNDGATWTIANSGIPSNANIKTLTASGSKLFAGTDSGIYSFNTTGSNWATLNTGLTNLTINILTSNGLNTYAFTNNGVFLLDNAGTIWSALNTGIAALNINKILLGTNLILAGNTQDIYYSGNNGSSWSMFKNGFPLKTTVVLQAIIGGNIYASIGGVLSVSNDNGNSWSKASVPNGVTSIWGNNAGVVLGYGNSTANLYFLNSNGTTWTSSNSGLGNTNGICTIASLDTNIYVGTQSNGVYLYSNKLSTWKAVNNGLPANSGVCSITFGGGNIYASVYSGTSNGIYMSSNNGGTWISVNNGFNYTPSSPSYANGYSLASIGNNIYGGTQGNGIFITKDNGSNWLPTNSGLPDGYINTIVTGTSSVYVGSRQVYINNLITSIENNSNVGEKVTISPNPSNGVINIKFNFNENLNTEIIVLNLHGQLILQNSTINNMRINIDLSHFEKGLYFVQIKNIKEIINKKIIIQ